MNSAGTNLALSLLLVAIGIIIKPDLWFKDVNQICSNPELPLTASFDKKDPLTLEKACSKQQLMQGLMFTRELESNKGMIFVFDKKQPISFWMKNTYIDLDIIFLDEHFRVVGIESLNKYDHKNPDLIPETLTYNAKYVIEVNKGYTKEKEIKEGSILTFTL